MLSVDERRQFFNRLAVDLQFDGRRDCQQWYKVPLSTVLSKQVSTVAPN